MSNHVEIRPGEIFSDIPLSKDAAISFIGVIRTPFATRADCPRQGRQNGPECRIEVKSEWAPALSGLEQYETIEVLYWLDKSRRDFLTQNPKHDARIFGTFALRSPNRPNPIGTSLVKLERIEANTLIVRGLDCLDGTPLVDIKPDRCAFSPKAPPKATDR